MEECRLRVFENVWASEERGNRGVEKTTYQGALRSVNLTRYHLGYQIKNTEMGRACSMYGEEERYIQGFNGET
jgi:hypothetical protein